MGASHPLTRPVFAYAIQAAINYWGCMCHAKVVCIDIQFSCSLSEQHQPHVRSITGRNRVRRHPRLRRQLAHDSCSRPPVPHASPSQEQPTALSCPGLHQAATITGNTLAVGKLNWTSGSDSSIFKARQTATFRQLSCQDGLAPPNCQWRQTSHWTFPNATGSSVVAHAPLPGTGQPDGEPPGRHGPDGARSAATCRGCLPFPRVSGRRRWPRSLHSGCAGSRPSTPRRIRP